MAVHLGRVPDLFERVAGNAGLREDGKAGAGVAVAPRGRLDPLPLEAIDDAGEVDAPAAKRLGEVLVGARRYSRDR
jgi:hypothetical protein